MALGLDSTAGKWTLVAVLGTEAEGKGRYMISLDIVAPSGDYDIGGEF